MAQNQNMQFCRLLYQQVIDDVRKVFPLVKLREAKVNKFGETWEFIGPEDFLWEGKADNAYHARAQGWRAWLAKKEAQ